MDLHGINVGAEVAQGSVLSATPFNNDLLLMPGAFGYADVGEVMDG